MWIVPLIALIIFEAFADIFAKEWSLFGNTTRLTATLIAYFLANIFWLFALKGGSGLARGSVLFSIASGILGTIIGLWLYKEPVGRYEMIAFALGIGSIIFFSLGESA